MMENTIVVTTLNYLLAMAPFIMFGFFISGIIHVFVSQKKIEKLFSGKGISPIFKASLIGVPLPLCSCSVIPMAATIRKNGASNGATSSFLISTPESSVDSIFVTYSMMGPAMAIIRPVVAFLSAFVAGILQQLFNNFEYLDTTKAQASCCSSETGCSSKKIERVTLAAKFSKVMRFSFIDLIDDMVLWLMFGIIAGVAIEFLFPIGSFEKLNGMWGRLAMLGIGVPLYVCASASTPIAAAMVAKGMSPGLALIFLLVGPATSISNILVLTKYIGKKGVFINVLVIALVALVASFFIDFVMPSTFSFFPNLAHAHIEKANWFEVALTVAFGGLMLRSLVLREIPKLIRYLIKKKSHDSCCG